MTTQRNLYERIFQVLLFEGLAISIFSPVLSWIVDKPLGDATALTVAISIIAMVWGFAFNSFFGILISYASNNVQKWKRVIHALGFETGLVLIAVPLSAWWLQMTFVQALLMDIGLLLVFLPYTFCFYWAYDMLRQRLVKAPLRPRALGPHKPLVTERRAIRSRKTGENNRVMTVRPPGFVSTTLRTRATQCGVVRISLQLRSNLLQSRRSIAKNLIRPR
jgi:uncharacterized membrane protein